MPGPPVGSRSPDVCPPWTIKGRAHVTLRLKSIRGISSSARLNTYTHSGRRLLRSGGPNRSKPLCVHPCSSTLEQANLWLRPPIHSHEFFGVRRVRSATRLEFSLRHLARQVGGQCSHLACSPCWATWFTSSSTTTVLGRRGRMWRRRRHNSPVTMHLGMWHERRKPLATTCQAWRRPWHSRMRRAEPQGPPHALTVAGLWLPPGSYSATHRGRG